MKNEEKNLGVPIALAVVGIFEFCYGTIVLRFWEMPQLWGGFVSSLLGAVITVCITAVLLNQQTKQQQKLQQDQTDLQLKLQRELLKKQSEAEEDKERNVKVFKKKTEVFQGYINLVWKIWGDQKIDAKEFKEMTTGYYRDLMIYLDDKKLFDGKKATEIIANCISKIGDFIDKPCFGAKRDELRGYVVRIINVLSDQIGLGGRIDDRIIADHDKQMFPAVFKNALIDAFNTAFAEALKDGTFGRPCWLCWNEVGAKHEGIAFEFAQYPGCGIRIYQPDIPVKAYERYLRFGLFVDVGERFRVFDDYRANRKTTGWGGIYIRLDEHNLFKPLDGEEGITGDKEGFDVKTPPFDFKDEQSLENIRQNVDFQEEARVLAKRSYRFFREVKVSAPEDTKQSILEFMNAVTATASTNTAK